MSPGGGWSAGFASDARHRPKGTFRLAFLVVVGFGGEARTVPTCPLPRWHRNRSSGCVVFPRFLALCSFFCAVAASAQNLGETQQAIVARHGAPIEENHAKGTAVYRRGPWKIDVTYADGVAKQLKVTKLNSLTEEEIHSVLATNADGAT